MYLPLALFALAALAGLVMAVRVFGGSAPPWALSLAHAAFGAAGIVTLLLFVLVSGSTLLYAALGLFVVAALGGFYLASFHLRGAAHPKGVVVLHAALAVAGFAILAAAAFNLL